jgi:glyoxylase-like metal-dependent hydrolase (beta-lactamase superfamily II)
VRLEHFVTGPFQENTYLVADEPSGAAAIIDPGDDAPVLIAAVRNAGLALQAMWLTHAHLDHLGAVAALKRVWNVPVLLHPADLPLYRSAGRQAAAYGLVLEEPPEPDGELQEGQQLTLGALAFDVMHAPGHSPGHVVIHGHGVAFVGDCLFAGSIGRTDLPLSDGAALLRSLRRIAELPPETRVLSGHGPATTIGAELRTNPFLTGAALPVR